MIKGMDNKEYFAKYRALHRERLRKQWRDHYYKVYKYSKRKTRQKAWEEWFDLLTEQRDG